MKIVMIGHTAAVVLGWSWTMWPSRSNRRLRFARSPASRHRTRSSAAGRIQSLNGAPLRKAPGLRAKIGT